MKRRSKREGAPIEPEPQLVVSALLVSLLLVSSFPAFTVSTAALVPFQISVGRQDVLAATKGGHHKARER
jgi:hypothetical protein